VVGFELAFTETYDLAVQSERRQTLFLIGANDGEADRVGTDVDCSKNTAHNNILSGDGSLRREKEETIMGL